MILCLRTDSRIGHCHLTHTQTFNGPLSVTSRVSQYQKGNTNGNTNLDFTEARDEWPCISWAICKSAPRCRQITMLTPHHCTIFTGRMHVLLPNQQRQSTEGNHCHLTHLFVSHDDLPTCEFCRPSLQQCTVNYVLNRISAMLLFHGYIRLSVRTL